MKYAMGSVFAPVIEYVTNLVYQLMKAIQSVAYALTGVNIFAKASASSYASMADSASKASKESKSLAGIDEINNIGGNDSGSNSSSSGNTAPSFDLSNVDGEMSLLSRKLYDFFEPLKESWQKYGSTVIKSAKNALKGMISGVSATWKSFEQIITNGTVYSILSNILDSIGEIGQSWADAWNNDDNGTEIIQGIANMIQDLTDNILDLVKSTGFQSYLDGIISVYSGIVQFLEPILSGFGEMAEIILEIVMSNIGKLLETVGNALQSIAQNETAAEILKAVGSAIAIIAGAIIAWNVAQIVLNTALTIFDVLISPITLIILGIVAAITAVILAIKNWGAISEWFKNLWTNVKDKIVSIVEIIKTTVKDKFNTLKDNITTIFTNIKTKIIAIFTNIKTKITTIASNIYTNVKSKFTNLKDAVINIFNTLKTKISSIFSGIWTNIKKVINSILGGIEGMANGIVKGINKVIQAMNRIKFNVPDWVPGMGGKSFGFNVSELRTISIPRLAKGNVATEQTLAIFGEYTGAKSNPEITAPQSIIYDTVKQALSDSAFTSNRENNAMPKEIVIKFGSYRVAYELQELIRKAQRQNGNTTVTI